MTSKETRAMLLCGLVAAISLTAITQVQYWYDKSHHLLTGPLAVDGISQWWTEYAMWLITLLLGAVGGCLLYLGFQVIRSLLSRKSNSGTV